MSSRFFPLSLLGLFFLFPLGTNSQWTKKGPGEGAELRAGSPYPVIDAEKKWYFTVKKKGVAVRKVGEKNFHIQIYDPKKLGQVAHQEHELPKDKMLLEGVVELRGNVYILYNWWDEKKKHERLYARRVDLKDASMEEPRKILEFDRKIKGEKVWFGFFKSARNEKFDFYSSAKKDHLLIRYRFVENEGSEEEPLAFSLLSEDLQEQWSSRGSFSFPEKKMIDTEYEITRNGTFYVLTTVMKEEEKGGDQRVLMKLNSEQEKFEVTQNIQLEERSIYDLSAFTPDDGGLLLWGSYTNEEDGSGVKGLFTLKIDSNGNRGSIHHHAIPMEMMVRFEEKERRQEYKKKGRSHKKVGMDHLKPAYTCLLENGDRIIIGEEAYYDVRYVNDDRYIDYYHNDLVAMRIDPQGQVKWKKLLPKRQTGNKQHLVPRMQGIKKAPFKDLSFKVVNGSEEIHLLYMENAENKGIGPKEVPEPFETGEEGVLTSYSLSKKSGDVTKNWLIDFEEPSLSKVRDKGIHQFGLGRLMIYQDGSSIFEVYKKRGEDILIKTGLEG